MKLSQNPRLGSKYRNRQRSRRAASVSRWSRWGYGGVSRGSSYDRLVYNYFRDYDSSYVKYLPIDSGARGHAYRYAVQCEMIRSFKHRGLKRLYERGDYSRVPSDHLDRIEDVLARLDVAGVPADLDLPGYGLHPLRGKFRGFWAVKISANWRIIFRLKGGDVFDLNLIDYH